MSEYRHPYALDSVAGHLPARVTLAGRSYDVGDDGTIQGDPPRNAVERLAAANGLDAEDLRESTADAAPGEAVCTCDPGDACDVCGGKCPTVKSDGEVCGRDRPCSYHDEEDE